MDIDPLLDMNNELHKGTEDMELGFARDGMYFEHSL